MPESASARTHSESRRDSMGRSGSEILASCVGGDCLETVKAMFEIGENQAVEFRWKDQSRVAVPVGLQDSGNRSRERSLGHIANYTEIPFISSCHASTNL